MTENISTIEKTHQSIDELKNGYDRIFKDGSLMQCHVSMWNMSTRLDQDDLALQPDTQIPNIFLLGKKMLINPVVLSEFKRIESRARAYLRNNSFLFPISDAHFVPNSKLDDMSKSFDRFKEEYDLLTESFIANYENYKSEFLTLHNEHRASLEDHYPNIDYIRARFKFSYTQFRISLPSLDEEVKFAVDKEVSSLTAEHRRRFLEQAEKQKQMLLEFTADAAELLRNKVLTCCTHVAEKIKKGEIVSRTNIKTLVSQVTSFKELNFLNDQEMESQLDGLLTLLNGGANVDIKELETQLTGVLENTRSLSDVSELTGEYFRAIEL